MGNWRFIDDLGTFEMKDPQRTSYLYFPLVNEGGGMISVVTPNLHGDIKIGQHAFLTQPVSVEDLHTSRAARNFWVHIKHQTAWSVTGNSAMQIATDDDIVTLTAGFLWHKVVRENCRLGLRAEVINFVPAGEDTVELMKISLVNSSEQPLQLTPTAAIPIYGRSADNVRDHRHVTSLLHRIRCFDTGILVQPTLSFDERGHQPNNHAYAVLGAEGDGSLPVGFFPVMEDFIGEGGTLDWPKAIIDPSQIPLLAGTMVEGYEALGGLRFQEVTLGPGETREYFLVLAILSTDQEESCDESIIRLAQCYGNCSHFYSHLTHTILIWQEKLSKLEFSSSDKQFDGWLKWVTIQPTLRRLIGNSFLPYHDYGKGGRGWRDLWQDILALLLTETGAVDELLFDNFAGIRLDGSNATIIGNQPGEFKADRNNIPRVWMDHGAWPWLTTRLYIDQTGDLGFLLRPTVYFKDSHVYRCREHDTDWNVIQGTQQRTPCGDIYTGSILEHLLIQHLTAFFNVGEHNNIRLEGADWNDGMDMAGERGEGVAFTAFYASNLRQLSEYILDLHTLGIDSVDLADELLLLLDRFNIDGDNAIDYSSPTAKQARLAQYFECVRHTISGYKTHISLTSLSADLQAKAGWMTEHLRQNEWIRNGEGFAWFNGYYDNNGNRLEGDHPLGVRMTLTGQVFPLMGGIATSEQARDLRRSVEHYLFDQQLGGYRLNTNFHEVLHNMGRLFGFAYGHKENGAMFSHMAVMYAYALYQQDFVREAYRVLDTMYRHFVDFSTCRNYPGIPEYINERGRGMYPYLTGSASWYLLTLVTQVYGVRGLRGDLLLDPKLVKEQFDSADQAAVTTLFAGHKIRVVYHNPARLDYGEYQIDLVTLDGTPFQAARHNAGLLISRKVLSGLADEKVLQLTVLLKLG